MRFMSGCSGMSEVTSIVSQRATGATAVGGNRERRRNQPAKLCPGFQHGDAVRLHRARHAVMVVAAEDGVELGRLASEALVVRLAHVREGEDHLASVVSKFGRRRRPHAAKSS